MRKLITFSMLIASLSSFAGVTCIANCEVYIGGGDNETHAVVGSGANYDIAIKALHSACKRHGTHHGNYRIVTDSGKEGIGGSHSTSFDINKACKSYKTVCKKVEEGC